MEEILRETIVKFPVYGSKSLKEIKHTWKIVKIGKKRWLACLFLNGEPFIQEQYPTKRAAITKLQQEMGPL